MQARYWIWDTPAVHPVIEQKHTANFTGPPIHSIVAYRFKHNFASSSLLNTLRGDFKTCVMLADTFFVLVVELSLHARKGTSARFRLNRLCRVEYPEVGDVSHNGKPRGDVLTKEGYSSLAASS